MTIKNDLTEEIIFKLYSEANKKTKIWLKDNYCCDSATDVVDLIEDLEREKWG